MIRTNGFIRFLLLSLLVLSTSCRKEESLFIGDVPEERLLASSNVVSLLTQVATKDGSDDNIIDGASCITLQLPLIVNVDGTEIIVDGPEDYETLEVLVDNDGDDEGGILEIEFPVTVIFEDYSETTVATDDELRLIVDQCRADGDSDDDIECVDIQYPVNVSFFDTISEQFDVVSLTGDGTLYTFMAALDTSSIATLEFPVSILLSDETEVSVSGLSELENIIEMSKDDCDENDNIDFEVDDTCEGCNNNQLLELWAGCSEWKAHKFARDGNNIKNQYDELLFHFMQDGTVEATSDTDSFIGTWAANGMNDDATFTVNIPGLEDFNAVWNIKEIKMFPGKPDVRLELGDDELHFQRGCSMNGNGNDNDNDDDDDGDDDG